MKNQNVFPQKISLFLLITAIIIGMTAACRSAKTTPTATPSPSPRPTETPAVNKTATPRSTYTPTPAPLGHQENPLVWGLILTEDDPRRLEAAETIAFLISADTDYALEIRVYNDFQQLSEDILDGRVHLFWLQPLEYIYLNWEERAEILLMSNHLGVYAYGVQFLANQSRGFTPNFDPDKGTSPGDPRSTLQQFAGTRPCLTSPNSLAGHLVPMGLLANTSTPTRDPVFIYDYGGIVRALYIQEICDFGVSYALTGDPRTASDIQQSFPNIQETVITIWQSEGIIPNLGLAASPKVDLPMRTRLQEAFLDLSRDESNLQNLSQALMYDIEAIQSIPDSFYNPLRDILLSLELDLEAILQWENQP